MYLRLNNPAGRTGFCLEFGGCRFRFPGIINNDAFRNCNTEFTEDGLALVFVDIHGEKIIATFNLRKYLFFSIYCYHCMVFNNTCV
jgi:hypothetical protein